MNWEKWLAIIGLIIGLPSFFLLFGSHVALASMGVAACAIFFLAAGWVHYRISLPPYSFSKIVAHVEITGADGALATVTKNYKCRPNFGHLDFMRHKNIAADGDIFDFRWNEKLIDNKDIELEMGEYVVTVKFGACLPAFKTFSGKLSYKLKNSFPANIESWIWVADFPTKLALVKVSLPQDRPCTDFSGHVSLGGIQKSLDSVQATNGNRDLELEIRRPKVGAEYQIVWHW